MVELALPKVPVPTTRKTFQRSRIPIDKAFLSRVVPGIVSNTPSLGVAAGPNDNLLAAFLTINRDLRQQNNATIAALASKTAPEMRWKDAFTQLGHTQVESRFADHRLRDCRAETSSPLHRDGVP